MPNQSRVQVTINEESKPPKTTAEITINNEAKPKKNKVTPTECSFACCTLTPH